MLPSRQRRHRQPLRRRPHATAAIHARRLREALPVAGVPVRLDAITGPRLLDAVRGGNPVTAEHAWSTDAMWHDAFGSSASRVGDLLAVDLPAERRLMLLAAPGAVLRASDHAAIASLLESRDVSFLPAPTAALIEPVVHECGYELRAPSGDADHVLSALSLSTLERWSGSRGKAVRRFDARSAARAVVREGRLTETWARDHLVAAFGRWTDAKFGGLESAPAEIVREYGGVLRWPIEVDAAQIRLFCLELDGNAIGVSAVQTFAAERVFMGVLMKTDPGVTGSTGFLRRHVARVAVEELGATAVLNVQQDDDLPQLRSSKHSYAPLRTEPKFAVVRP